MQSSKSKKLITLWLAAILLVQCLPLSWAAEYPDALLRFSGIAMQTNCDTVQGFVDVTISMINATGVQFSLEYDTRYLTISDVQTNEPIDATGDVIDMNRYFQANDIFPAGSLYSGTDIGGVTTVDSTMERALFNIIPDPRDDAPCGEYIEEIEDEDGYKHKYFTANSVDGVRLGRISFRIVDPAGLAQLTAKQLNDVIHVHVPEGDAKPDVHISYFDNNNVLFYDTEEHLDYEWDIHATLLKVEPKVTEKSVLAPEIYTIGSEQDLVDYLNRQMRGVILYWSDGSVATDRIRWGAPDKSISITPTYDPRGGDYTITQEYNNKFSVTATVHVVSVHLMGLWADNDSITYPPDGRPAAVEDLLLPAVAHPIADRVHDLIVMPDVAIDSALWSPAGVPSALVNDPAPVACTITASNIPTDALQTACPWLTIDDGFDASVSVDRFVGEQTPAPANVTAAVDDITGIMTITIADYSAPSGTQFRVRMPDGNLVDTDMNGVTATISGTTVTVEIDTAQMSDSALSRAVQQRINLGDQNDGFSIAAQQPGMGWSDETAFSSATRQNAYTEDKVLDYSGGRQKLFPLPYGTPLSTIDTYLALPDDETLRTRYHGISGEQPAYLRSFRVESWTLEAGDLNTPGSNVTLKGTLADEMYTNFGLVENPDGHTVTLKLTTGKTPYKEASIEDLPDFIFDKKQQGYGVDKLQTAVFSIRNTGGCDISGLTVTLSNTDFILVSEPDLTLLWPDGATAGESTTFAIRTKHGLPAQYDAGDKNIPYTAQVTISSNEGVLDTFTVYFTVTRNPVYTVIASVNDPVYGSAVVIGSSTYEAGETVEVHAIPAEPEYRLDDKQPWIWVAPGGGGNIEFDPKTPEIAKFIMPDHDVGIQAVFVETIAAKLRLADLQVRNPDDTVNPLYADRTSYTPVAFSPTVFSYVVTVPNDTTQNKVWFRPRFSQILEANDVTAKVSVSVNGGAAVDVPCSAEGAGFVSDLFSLAQLPDENTVTITQRYERATLVEEVRYIVTILRKSKVGVTFVPGNSPYGLIEADTRWDNSTKVTAKDRFSEKNRYAPGYVPEDAGETAGAVYSSQAWGEGQEVPSTASPGIGQYINYDKDPSALFVYNGEPFRDPGFTGVANTQGDPVDISTISRSITVDELPAGGNVVDMLYAAQPKTIDISPVAQADVLIEDLQSLKIRPGVYKITYSFRDFDGTPATFSRPLIILAKKGDTDISRVVDTTDVQTIYRRVPNKLTGQVLSKKDAWCRVYKYRICDVNEDRNVNSIDANLLQSGKKITQYYVELPKS